jgi:hypothetical protein
MAYIVRVAVPRPVTFISLAGKRLVTDANVRKAVSFFYGRKDSLVWW